MLEIIFNQSDMDNVSLECHFGTSLVGAINIVVLGEFQSLIEIDANRNVLSDYTS